MNIETPFPVEGTITVRENGARFSFPCAVEWMRETGQGNPNYLKQAENAVAREFGFATTVRVRFTANRSGEACGGYELLGVDNAAATEEA